MRTRNYDGRTNGRTDGRIDRQTDKVITVGPPPTSGGALIIWFKVFYYTLNLLLFVETNLSYWV